MRTQNARAAGIMCLAVAAFVANDATMKMVAAGLPMVQILALRNAAVTGIFAAVAAGTGALRQWRTVSEPLVWSRAAADTLATLLYMGALPHVALTMAVTLNMATPLLMLPLAALFLRERITGPRALAVAVGFIGVLLVLRPGGHQFSTWIGLSAASALFFATRDVMTRRVPERVPTPLLAVTMTATLGVVCLAWTAAQGWASMLPAQWAAVGASALFISVGYYLAIVALRMGDLSLTSGFRYTAVPWSAAWGYALWREVPDAAAVGGVVLILGAGLYVLHGERREARMYQAGVGTASPR